MSWNPVNAQRVYILDQTGAGGLTYTVDWTAKNFFSGIDIVGLVSRYLIVCHLKGTIRRYLRRFRFSSSYRCANGVF